MPVTTVKWQLILLPVFLTLFCTSAFTGCKSGREDARPGISISFDDQYVAEWFALRDLLNRYDAKVTFFITNADSLTEEERNMLHVLQQDGHEIGSHGSMHVNAEYFIREHSYRKYFEEEIFLNNQALAEAGFRHPSAFAYPYGAKYWFTDYLLLRHFKVLRDVAPPAREEELSALAGAFYEHDNSPVLSAANIDVRDGLTPAMIDKAIERAVRKKEVLLLFGHLPAQEPDPKAYNFDIDFLEYILKSAKVQGLHFYRISDLHRE